VGERWLYIEKKLLSAQERWPNVEEGLLNMEERFNVEERWLSAE
jgi:hypothetical protein